MTRECKDIIREILEDNTDGSEYVTIKDVIEVLDTAPLMIFHENDHTGLLDELNTSGYFETIPDQFIEELETTDRSRIDKFLKDFADKLSEEQAMELFEAIGTHALHLKGLQ